MTFSVEIANSKELLAGGHHIEIYIDHKNLDSLIKRLEKLTQKSVGEDLHFMSASWGLGDLSETIHASDNVITHHLKIIISE